MNIEVKAKTSPKAREAAKRYRDKRVAEGLCISCGKHPPAPRKTRCASCLESARKVAADLRALRQAKNLCVVCGSASPLKGYKECLDCRQKHQEATKRSKSARASQGLCVDCGVAPRGDFLRCPACRKKIADYNAKRRQKESVKEPHNGEN